MTVYRPYCYRTCSDVKTTMFVQWYWHPIHWQSDTRVNQDVLRNWWSFLPIVLYLMGIQGCHPGRHFKIANTVCEFSSIFGRVKLTLNEWEKMKVVIVKMVKVMDCRVWSESDERRQCVEEEPRRSSVWIYHDATIKKLRGAIESPNEALVEFLISRPACRWLCHWCVVSRCDVRPVVLPFQPRAPPSSSQYQVTLPAGRDTGEQMHVIRDTEVVETFRFWWWRVRSRSDVNKYLSYLGWWSGVRG